MAAPQARGRNGQRGGGYTYQPRSEKQNKARADQTGQRFDSIFKSGFDVYKPKVGDNAIRILPPTWENFEHYGFDVWLHSYVGVDRGSYLCLKKMLGKPCPICAAVTEAKEAGETEDAKKMDAGRRVAVWLLDRNDDDDLTPKLYAMPWGTDKEIMNQAADSRSGKTLMIDHPDDGYDIMFKRTGEGVKTKYIAFKIDRDATPISDDQKAQDEVMDFIQETPIPETLNYFPPEYLARIMEGTVEEKDTELDDEIGPETGEVTQRRGAKSARGRGEPADEVDERTPARRRRAEPEPEEVEDDPPPRRSARRSEPEPEETEDNPPPRRRVAERTRAPRDESEQEEMEAQQARRPRRGSAEPEETEDDPPPRRSTRRAEPEPEDDPPPQRRGARRAEPEPEETEDEPQPPRRGSRRAEPEPEESEDDPPPPRRTRR